MFFADSGGGPLAQSNGMMKHVALASVMVALVATSAAAQGRGNGRRDKGVPPGHMPPPGSCRVWVQGVPPGRQAPPTSCAEAERDAMRNGGRVIYGGDRDGDRTNRGSGGGGILGDILGRGDRDTRGDRREPRDRRDGEIRGGTDNRRPTARGERSGRAIPRDDRDDRYESSRRINSVAADNGYRDGLVKGREDAEDGDSYDPDRHSWYRSANRGYSSRYGSRDQYARDYRAAFADGYDEAYRDAERRGARNGERSPWWWPF